MAYRYPPPATGKLRVWVNNDFFLDAGDYETVVGLQGPEQIIHPPKITLFEQVFAYLKSAPDPGEATCPTRRQEGVAAAAVTLRWGSYLAVLLDRDKPKWNIPDSHNTEHISNGEMARINIESSAALAAWIATFNDDHGGPTYRQLVNRALAYLPMPKLGRSTWPFMFGALAEPEAAVKLIHRHTPSQVNEVRAIVAEHSTRALANAFTNCAWRMGPVEDLHAGHFRGYPLDKQRIGITKERNLMTFASVALSDAMWICREFAMEQPRRSYAEQVLPFGLGEEFRITPENWTVTESSREVHLPLVWKEQET